MRSPQRARSLSLWLFVDYAQKALFFCHCHTLVGDLPSAVPFNHLFGGCQCFPYPGLRNPSLGHFLTGHGDDLDLLMASSTHTKPLSNQPFLCRVGRPCPEIKGMGAEPQQTGLSVSL
jgi:hypothetical protein